MKRDPYMFRIGRLRLAPDDVVVLQTELMLDKDQSQVVHDRAKANFPEHQVLVLSHGVTVRVLNKTKAAALKHMVPRKMRSK
jgi:hypothetical protein